MKCHWTVKSMKVSSFIYATTAYNCYIPSGLVFCIKKAGHKSHKFYLNLVYQKGIMNAIAWKMKYVQVDC